MYEVDKLYTPQRASVQIWNYCEMLVTRTDKVNFVGHAVCTDKVDSLWCHHGNEPPHFLTQQPAQHKGFVGGIFLFLFFFEGPGNLFLFMEAVLEARASDALVARSCKME